MKPILIACMLVKSPVIRIQKAIRQAKRSPISVLAMSIGETQTVPTEMDVHAFQQTRSRRKSQKDFESKLDPDNCTVCPPTKASEGLNLTFIAQTYFTDRAGNVFTRIVLKQQQDGSTMTKYYDELIYG